ncbi:MAG TPA: ATP-dependent 6-phosphofructokinase [Deltaproteobacteria bacterium]|nr:ATP-dependent 6-phosphofructokinase [Deltaproteobacteria bacterium]HOM28273.1 ATP-dependent 6-phosphofructokinase [Deltaproteobacteria bacterium]HPP80176.1 ATP-dependent 6-phosphofructokinase [Deltaproteobacteria bacterium]
MNQEAACRSIETTIKSLGRATIDSPVSGSTIFVEDHERVVIDTSLGFFKRCMETGSEPVSFELAGPRRKIYFDPSKTKCAIVTCGGLCPGINDVIRSLVLELHYAYRVENIYGVPYGLQGFIPSYGHALVELTPDAVEHIHELGGTVLGSSRGSQDIGEIVDALERLNMNIVFFIGGDGTLKAASSVAREALERGYRCAVIAIPKTIDNDIAFVSKTFGFDTAVEEARKVITCAHAEAKGAPNGIGLVKLMGRDSGFIAANAALASRDVNFVLVPEEDFDLEGPRGFLCALEKRIRTRGHAVVVVAEGAGQKFFTDMPEEKDASGNVRKHDIGVYLKERIERYFQEVALPVNLKYIDPSYTIRSVTANASDSIFCGFLAQMAVHAGMCGKTDMLIGLWNNVYVHIPTEICMQGRKKIDVGGPLWMSVREATGQPVMVNEG